MTAVLGEEEAAEPVGELVAFGLAMEEAREALTAALRRADAAETELGELADRIGAVIAAAGAAERKRADAAEAKVAEYENGITWDTTCLSCARILDSAIQETFRREQAEAKLESAREGIGNFLGEYGDSEIPMFKVAQDLANSLLKVLGPSGGEEASGA